MINQLFSDLSALPEVEAIALGGSRAGTNYDEKSDYDVYLYCTGSVSEETRRHILGKYCSYMEIGNHFWEYEDNCTLKNGVDIDILYRNLNDFTAGVANVVENFQPSNGYTTCMWHNLRTCKIVCDKTGRLAQAKDRFNVPYPSQLKHNIIERNRKLLQGTLPAYNLQINKAVQRKDLVSMNHRVSAFMESYFDILFALNEQTHPGEKRLISLCKQHCSLLPENFENNLTALFTDLFNHPEKVSNDLNAVLTELTKIL